MAFDGSLYVHLDYRKIHYVKTVLDEVFGEQKFVNEVIWQRTASHNDPGRYGSVHDTLLYYKNGSGYVWNEPKMEQSQKYIDSFFVYAESPLKKEWVKLKKGQQAPPGWERYRLGNFASPHPRPNLIYEYEGYKPPKNGWKVDPSRMEEMDRLGLLHFPRNKNGRIQPKQYLKNTLDNKAVSDVWTGIAPLQSQSAEKQNYPTQKPEALLSRIVQASSNPGDVVLDCFAGSGTVCAVAEKLGRRWVGIDCGKLAIYTMQRRMLNLRKGIGNKQGKLEPKPFTLFNAGLYDFSKLKDLSWDAWRFFALQLFQCRDDVHKVGGVQLDGYLKGASVLVFNHQKNPGARFSEETLHELHEALGSRVGTKMFIIAPALTFDFQQDWIDLDGVRYYALRIPYSIINELHSREFTALKQPSDETAVNDTVEAVGFDFIRTPDLEYESGRGKKKGDLFESGFIRVKTFRSEAVVREPSREKANLETLSMVMLNYDYDGEVFDLDAVFYADKLANENWEIRFPLELLGKQLMVVLIDIYGNEARVVIEAPQFDAQQQQKRSRKVATAK